MIDGKYFYSDDLTDFNFERRTLLLSDALDLVMKALDDPAALTVYIGSVAVNDCLPGFSVANSISYLRAEIGPRIWIGHVFNVSCHFDTYENVACVVAGERRFTLYPPECIGDLYAGPLDHTMAGQPVSLAAAAGENQTGKYPKFAKEKDKALIADLRRRRPVSAKALVASGGGVFVFQLPRKLLVGCVPHRARSPLGKLASRHDRARGAAAERR